MALTIHFYISHYARIAGSAKFAARPDEGKVAELEGLKEFLGQAIALIDAKAVEMAAPAARMRKLLTAPDKRATLLQMAGDLLNTWMLPSPRRQQQTC